MPLQNRVRPDGAIVAVEARGTLTGNRGIIHDATSRTLLRRRWTARAWIVCVLEFRGARRAVMSPGTWTELFFLDEVTALAAGHRPCYYCRRAAASTFARAFAVGAGLAGVRAPEIDRRLHAERWASAGVPGALPGAAWADLPDGAMVMREGVPFALRGPDALPWSPGGYGAAVPRDDVLAGEVALITPPSTCRALAAGYLPAWHGSA